MSKEELLNELLSLQGDGDTEINHWNADKLLCAFLESLGYKDVVDAYKMIDKWYA